MDKLNYKFSPEEKKADLYLDACSTTPPTQEVINKITQVQQLCWGNPSSIHLVGVKAAEVLESSRISICNLLNSDIEDLVFTSGATESINTAIVGTAQSISPGRIVISALEHPAVIESANKLRSMGWDVLEWPVTKYGLINLDLIDKILAPPTRIVSIIWGQSEIGTIQPIELLANETRKREIIFHTDATQILPHYVINMKKLPIDLLSASAHKFQGPKGVGLLIRKHDNFNYKSPFIVGGGQEGGSRSGTEPVAMIAGMAVALEQARKRISFKGDANSVKSMTEYLRNMLSELPGIRFSGHPKHRLENHISLLLSNKNGVPVSGREVVRVLSNYGIYVSSGSACKSGTVEDSKALKAMGIESKWLKSGLRLSLGPWVTKNQLEILPKILDLAVNQANPI